MTPDSARYRILPTANGWTIQHRHGDRDAWSPMAGGFSTQADAIKALGSPQPLYFDADRKEITCG